MSRIWAKRGSRPRIKRDRRFTWAYLFGAICPARGTGAALVMPEVSIEAMNKHLVEISQNVSVSAIALLILDGAGWHSSPHGAEIAPHGHHLYGSLACAQPKHMRKLWGNVTGERLWYALHGYDLQTPPSGRGMYGHPPSVGAHHRGH